MVLLTEQEVRRGSGMDEMTSTLSIKDSSEFFLSGWLK